MQFFFFAIFLNSDWVDVVIKHTETVLKRTRYLFKDSNCLMDGIWPYLNIFGELVIGEDTEGREVTDRIELENDLNGLSVAWVVTPSDPTFNGRS